MITTRTPLRVSFVGGGSDLKSFYSLHGGAVLSTSINKYIYISTHTPLDDYLYTVKHSEIETADSYKNIEHPIIRETLKKMGIEKGLEISSTSDVPPGTGMGSSSAFTVALFENLYSRKGMTQSKIALADEASDMEINILGEPIGKQDHYAAAVGGLNILRFNKDDSVSIEPVIPADQKRLEDNLLMFYTGKKRKASTILSQQNCNMALESKQEILKTMVSYVDTMADAVRNGDYNKFGEILHKNWMLKKQLASGISSEYINKLYEKALQAGALGGKLLGAGGGGFLLFYCEEERQSDLRQALKELREFPFKFESEGSRTVFSDEENLLNSQI